MTSTRRPRLPGLLSGISCTLLAIFAQALSGRVASAVAGEAGAAGRKYDFAADVLPVLRKYCIRCHGAAEVRGGLRLHDADAVRKGGIEENLIVPGRSADSYLIKRILGEGGEDPMPPKGERVAPEALAALRGWIDQGAVYPREDTSFRPALAGVRRLTDGQYRNAIRDVLGVTVDGPLHPQENPDQFSSMLAYRATTAEWSVELYRETALRAARALFSDPRRRLAQVGCTPRRADDACGARFIATTARRLWRRPVDPAELRRYHRLARRADIAARDPWMGLAAATAALLQSPHFLYADERGVPGPENPEHLRLDDFALAARLALFLWSSVPDEALLAAAEQGRLATADGVRAEARRMVEHPRAREAVLGFFSELLTLDEVARLAKDPALFPHNTPALRRAMAEEVRRLVVRQVFEREEDVLELFETRETFVNDALAALYGLAGEFPRDELVPVTLPEDSPRVGLLGTGAFLALNALTTRGSPTLRGVFVRERLLCQEVPPPPPNVNSELPEPDEHTGPRTMRERLAAHATNKACASCHQIFDPIGLALEHFDGIGAFRATDGGLAIDVRGVLDGAAYEGLPGLARALRRHPRAEACMTEQLYRYATGHRPDKREQVVLDDLLARFRASGRNLKTLLVEVAASDGFRYVRPEPAPVATALRNDRPAPGKPAGSPPSSRPGETR